ncbi:MAG: chemotaxis protein CheD [Thermoleophilia bacterium]|nr:chemotaxis protein CheD [Thermoleophilia bacterium]
MTRKSDTFVPIGCIAASTTRDEVLVALGLGSCIGVALWCGQSGAVGLAHIYLPSSVGAEVPDNRPAKFADIGVPALIAAVESLGGVRARMAAFLVGGAQMFEFESRMTDGPNSGVGMRNDAAVRAALAAEGIPISGTETGGISGRSMRISPHSTWVSVYSAQERHQAAMDALKDKAAAAHRTTSITPATRALGGAGMPVPTPAIPAGPAALVPPTVEVTPLVSPVEPVVAMTAVGPRRYTPASAGQPRPA